jgi:DNA excision repair protein ERCC-2
MAGKCLMMMEQVLQRFFPHEHPREVQLQMMKDVHDALLKKKNIIMHAPTGIGKTASSLVPALDIASKKGLTIFFLTSRHTQHHIVIETLKKIKQKNGVSVAVADIIGKKSMCSQEGVEGFHTAEFYDYCKKLREEQQCEFYTNTRKSAPTSLTVQAKKTLEELKFLVPLHVEETNDEARRARLCPYEVAVELARGAQIIITDYYYLFNPGIRMGFFHKIDKELSKAIIIVDEAHNLPERIRNLATEKLSTFILERAITEAKKVDRAELVPLLENILAGLGHLIGQQQEMKIRKEQFMEMVTMTHGYEDAVEELVDLGQEIQVESKRSFLLSVGRFLGAWQGENEGYCRILSKNEKNVVLTYRCLDPALLTKEVVSNAYATVMMSGTLKPTSMYKDVLGFEEAVEKEYPNPFPKKNRLTLIVPKTTTKFTARSEAQYKDIAVWCSGLLDEIPGHVALFFPSYLIRDVVYKHLHTLSDRKFFVEKPKLTKEGKKELIEQFKKHKNAALLGASTGSFGEGLDMPGVLKGVVVVGLPLQKPDLETQSLIDYYDRRFGKGWDYGYVFPAMTRCLQNAGRCIRSEHDKGVLVFLEERFAWHNYLSLFPKDWEMVVDARFKEHLEEFFDSEKSLKR